MNEQKKKYSQKEINAFAKLAEELARLDYFTGYQGKWTPAQKERASEITQVFVKLGVMKSDGTLKVKVPKNLQNVSNKVSEIFEDYL